MEITHTVRRTDVALPVIDEAHLGEVDSIDGDLDEFSYVGSARLRELNLSGTHLLDGRITGLTAQRVRLEQLRVDSVVFSGCDLSNLHWSDSKLSRVVFQDCKLLGATLEEITFGNVLFERCKLDLTVFARVRAAEPVIFSSCSLRETTFAATDLSGVAIDDCDLTLAEFDGGKYRNLDVRGTDLSSIRGLFSLKGIIIDRWQTRQLAEALAAELEVTFGEDLDES
ncbi:pentapeptide repeat-containing protein [Rhizohabitans arisaemae]|uniref:pentapeptide repeat-containing protein n=1 Tax=Rhizohabitans arisaemae TaxID=2720610 RepID=UPI0024B11E48|nr:pentapeptide repeat-containing protein [Rhizohabitans arisaemae]